MNDQPPALEGKRVLITGGSMGIGYACAEACLQAGALVTVCAKTQEPLNRAVHGLQAQGHRQIVGRTADVSKIQDVDDLLDFVETQHGRLDGLVQCAAIIGPIGRVMDLNPEEWLETLRVNLFGTFLVARQCSKLMQKSGGGRMVLFSGGGASGPFPNYSAYACSKVGVVRFAETLAQEMLPFNIEVNCLAPGFVITRMHEATLAAGEKAGKQYLDRTKREMESGGVSPNVAARAVVFLLSDHAKGITGKFIAAPYDGWDAWPKRLDALQKTDVFTLRRIVPKDRGMDWQ